MPLPAEMARVFTEEKIDFVKRCASACAISML